MRWTIEVSSVGKADRQAYCVESESWQRALQVARGLREDHGPMTGFSIELLNEGFSAIDPRTRLRYFVKRAPDDAPLSGPDHANKSSSPAPAPRPIAEAKTPPRPDSVSPPQAVSATPKTTNKPSIGPSKGSSKTVMFASSGAALVAEVQAPAEGAATTEGALSAPLPARLEVPRPHASAPPAALTSVPRTKSGLPRADPPPSSSAAAAPPESVRAPTSPSLQHALSPVLNQGAQAPSARLSVSGPATLPGVEVLYKREHDPDANSPLTYREYVYFFPAASDEAMAKAMLIAQFDLVRSTLQDLPAGKLVNLAIFDVSFADRPPVAPVVTLSWKDWTGEPTIDFPRRAQAGVPSVSPPQAGVPPGLANLPGGASSQHPISGGFPPPRLAPASDSHTQAAPATGAQVAPEPKPFAAGPPPTDRRSSRPSKSSGRLRGDELIADLFEAMHDLHFLRDSVEGAAFCLMLALEKIPSRVGIVHLYDIDRREFVVASVRGPNQEAALLQRYPEGDPVLSVAMRRQRAIIWGDVDEANALSRYRFFGGARSLIVAPVVLAGRFLGALELLDPVDGLPFNDEEGHALTYIAEQFAEFIATRGMTVDPERIVGSSRG
jgi:hypothetical protein